MHGQTSQPGDGPDRSDRLEAQVAQLARVLERSNVVDYLALTQRPWRLFWVNFLAGAARGLGIAFGLAVLSALLLSLLKTALVHNLPVIGEWIADLVRIVELHRAY